MTLKCKNFEDQLAKKEEEFQAMQSQITDLSAHLHEVTELYESKLKEIMIERDQLSKDI